jgi:predicted nucleic acid-binding protein
MPDEQNTYRRLLAELNARRIEAIAPDIWWMEIINVLWVAERRGRTSPDETRNALTFLRNIPLLIIPTTTNGILDRTLDLSRQHNLAAYDAAYLELALREQVLLATIDTRLSAIARSLELLLEDPIIQ